MALAEQNCAQSMGLQNLSSPDGHSLLNFGKAAWAECARRAVCVQLVARVVDIQVAHGQLADAI